MPIEPQETRPDPDALLAQVKAQESRQARGRLKVFFGAAAGVGKTYAMLSAGRAKAVEGADVVVGYAEPHARPDTEVLLLGMEILPYRAVEYRGTTLKEFDLDAALKRRPELILVDELAHSNAPGLRHAKRWQDVEELLEAGIDVYTTLNVQHLESLNDVVAQITGVVVRETLPDANLEKADEIELVDLTPDELLERLQEGKVYVSEQAGFAAQNFFRKSNLTALRELALRKTAERVNEQVLSARQEQLARQTWPTAERILVCISPSPSSTKVIRAAKRMAVALRAEWIAAYVETPKFRHTSPDERERLQQNFRLAERLGAETVTLSGLVPADEIVNYARSRNATKIIAGKSDHPWWQDLFFRSNVDQLLRKSGEIDVYVIRGLRATPDGRGAGTEAAGDPETRNWRAETEPIDWPAYQWTAVVLLVCTAIAWGLYKLLRLQEHGDLSNLIMVYLVGVALVAARYGRLPSVIAAVVSVAVFDFVFVPPRYTFAVADTQYLITFLVMLGVALLIGTLTVRIREQAENSRQRERRTEALYRMTEQLAAAVGFAPLAEVALRHFREVFHAEVALLTPQPQGRLAIRAASNLLIARKATEQAVAQWVFEHAQPAGRGTDTLPASESLFMPLIAAGGAVGVVGLQAPRPDQLLAPEQRQLLDAFLNQVALAIERDELAGEARRAQVQAETEKMRSALLSSVSHDLRTPLAVITGASSSLLDGTMADGRENKTAGEQESRKPGPGSGGPGPAPDSAAAVQRELIQTIHDESQRLTRLVGNLLDLTRLESGAFTINKQWQSLEEIVGSALHHLKSQLADRPVTVNLPDDLPLILADGVLIDQLLVNLIENAAKYTPPGTPIEITAATRSRPSLSISDRATPPVGGALVTVADHGPGITPGEESRVFEKFYRGSTAGTQRGAGLGLPICRAIIDAHGGRLWVENRPPPDHGAIFHFTIPFDGLPPTVDDAEPTAPAPAPAPGAPAA